MKKEILASGEGIIEQIIQQTKIDTNRCQEEDFLFCTWEQCQEMKEDASIIFGSHSVTHQCMTVLSEKEVEKEAHLSKKIIEEKLDQPCTAFAYPFGECNGIMKAEIRKAGYLCGLSTEYGHNTKEADMYAVKRVCLNNRYELPIFFLTLFFNFPVFHHWLLKKYSKILSLF